MSSRPRAATGVELGELRVLEGPNRFFNRPAVKLEFVGDEPGLADLAAGRAGEWITRLHVEMGLPAPRLAYRTSGDARRALVAYPWRRRVIAQSIGAAAARLAMRRSTRPRELAA